jgi:hypothetical protein
MTLYSMLCCFIFRKMLQAASLPPHQRSSSLWEASHVQGGVSTAFLLGVTALNEIRIVVHSARLEDAAATDTGIVESKSRHAGKLVHHRVPRPCISPPSSLFLHTASLWCCPSVLPYFCAFSDCCLTRCCSSPPFSGNARGVCSRFLCSSSSPAHPSQSHPDFHRGTRNYCVGQLGGHAYAYSHRLRYDDGSVCIRW